MTTAVTLLTLITHAQQHVAPLESLAAGMVDIDHLYTPMTTQTRAINAQLNQVATVMEKAELRTAANDGARPPLRMV